MQSTVYRFTKCMVRCEDANMFIHEYHKVHGMNSLLLWRLRDTSRRLPGLSPPQVFWSDTDIDESSRCSVRDWWANDKKLTALNSTMVVQVSGPPSALRIAPQEAQRSHVALCLCEVTLPAPERFHHSVEGTTGMRTKSERIAQFMADKSWELLRLALRSSKGFRSIVEILPATCLQLFWKF